MIAHNGGRFDHTLFIRIIESENMTKDFKKLVAGFADSLYLLKNAFPDRSKEAGSFKLGRLANELLHVTGSFHEAMFDVKVLEKLCFEYIDSVDIKKKLIKYDNFVTKKLEQKSIRSKMPDLLEIKKITNLSVCKKIISNDLTYEKLQKKFQTLGQKLFKEFLMEKVGRSARITKNESYIKKILSHFEQM